MLRQNINSVIVNKKIRGLLVESERLQGYDIVSLGEYFPIFQSAAIPSPSEWNSQLKDFLLDCLTLNIKALGYFETSGITQPRHRFTSHKTCMFGNTAVRTKNHTCDYWSFRTERRYVPFSSSEIRRNGISPDLLRPDKLVVDIYRKQRGVQTGLSCIQMQTQMSAPFCSKCDSVCVCVCEGHVSRL